MCTGRPQQWQAAIRKRLQTLMKSNCSEFLNQLFAKKRERSEADSRLANHLSAISLDQAIEHPRCVHVDRDTGLVPHPAASAQVSGYSASQWGDQRILNRIDEKIEAPCIVRRHQNVATAPDDTQKFSQSTRWRFEPGEQSQRDHKVETAVVKFKRLRIGLDSSDLLIDPCFRGVLLRAPQHVRNAIDGCDFESGSSKRYCGATGPATDVGNPRARS